MGFTNYPPIDTTSSTDIKEPKARIGAREVIQPLAEILPLANNIALQDAPSTEQPQGKILRSVEDKYERWYVDDEGMVYERFDDENQTWVSTRLGSFSGQVEAFVKIDDGLEVTAVEHVAFSSAGTKVIIEADPAELMTKPHELAARALGPRAIVPAKVPPRRLSEAILRLSGDARVETHYRQTGWRKIDGELLYLHAGGAIGANGIRDDIMVDLPEALQRITLPAPATGKELCEGLKRVFDLLDLGEPGPLTAMLGAVFRAPVGKTGFSLWLNGKTGTRKSTLAALGEGFFAPTTTHDELPGNWKSTGNALAELQFLAAETLLVIDDYVPKAGRERILMDAAERVVRGGANHAARQRLRPDGTLRPARVPRCLTVITGETIPDGHSLRARMITVAMTENSLPISPALSEAQALAANGLFASVMAAWIMHLAKLNPATVRERWGHPQTVHHEHPRVNQNIHELVCTLQDVLLWGEEVGAFRPDETEAIATRLEEGMTAVVEEQVAVMAQASPVERFFRLLRAALAGGQAQICYPSQSVAYGDMDGKMVGWATNDNEVWLLPENSLAVVRSFAREAGEPWPEGLELGRALKDAGVLLDSEPPHTTARRSVKGSRYRVWVMSKDSLTDPAERQQVGSSS